MVLAPVEGASVAVALFGLNGYGRWRSSMKWYLFVIGIFWIMSGTLMALATGVLRETYMAKLKTLGHRTFSPFALAAGVLFFLSASSSGQPAFIIILGVLGIAKGLLLLFGPFEKVRAMVDWWFQAPDSVYRMWGFLALALGVAVLATIV